MSGAIVFFSILLLIMNFFHAILVSMSKRYSGKSFKDSSASKKPKLSLKEKRKNKKEKSKKS